MRSTAQVYTRPGRDAIGASTRATLAAVLALLPVAPAVAEEKIRVLVSTSPREVVEMRLDDYVAGVVAGEMPASFPSEALKAQAVAARSYVLTRKIEAQVAGRSWDVGTGVLSQVFRKGAGPAAREAAEATRGEVLVLGMEPVEAYYHASCGGRTEEGDSALGRGHAYLPSVECGRCDSSPRGRWKVRIGAKDLASAVGLPGEASAVRVVARTPTGRAARVEVEARGRKMGLSAIDLRRRLGYSRLPSVAYEVLVSGGEVVFEGRGHGHGAGLCQWGAAGLAREGKGYREILAHYYPGTDVVRMY